MSRSLFKGPLVNLIKKNKIFNKSLTILPKNINKTFLIYNGIKLIPIIVKENMIGYKFGEFLKTRKNFKYKKK